MKILVVFDLVDVGPGGEIDVGLLAEMIVFSVDNQINMSFEHDDDKVIFRSPGLGVPDVVLTLDFACENILVNISQSLYGFLAEEYRRFVRFGPFLCHMLSIVSPKIVKL